MPVGRPHGAFGLTFEQLWDRFLAEQRHLGGTTSEDYADYGRHHLIPFFGPHDVALIRRSPPLRRSDAVPGAVYVEDFVKVMLAKNRLNNVGRPVKDKLLTVKFIKNVTNVLGQRFDYAIEQRPAPIEVNPARGIRLPKQDRREVHFLQDAATYLALREEIHAYFQPLLDSSSAPAPGTGKPPACSSATSTWTPSGRSSTSAWS